jgi:hypothetical protein
MKEKKEVIFINSGWKGRSRTVKWQVNLLRRTYLDRYKREAKADEYL